MTVYNYDGHRICHHKNGVVTYDGGFYRGQCEECGYGIDPKSKASGYQTLSIAPRWMQRQWAKQEAAEANGR